MAVRRGTRGLSFALGVSLAVSLFGGAPVVAAAEPSGFEFYKTYEETEAIIDVAVADAPGIARKHSIGQSAEGRQIWAIELTTDIALGEQGKAEVVVYGLTQARERASAEMAVYMIRVLTNNYGRNTKLGRRVTRILDDKVVWIIPMLNPDGAEHDFSGGTFHDWAKNRQPLQGTSEVGVDIGRSFDFKWGCCAADGASPASDTYRGPAAWSSPEGTALRDFIAARNTGEQRITQMLSLHAGMRRVFFPAAYTSANLADGMTADDRAVFVALAKGMASRNNYKKNQRGDHGINDGDPDDWAFHEQGIFALTLDMAKGKTRRYYPSLDELNKDLVRNRGAVLWFLAQADCPHRAAGLADEHCVNTASPPPYAESVYRSGAGHPQEAGCLCLVATTQAWLEHIDTALEVSQTALHDYITPHDKSDWRDPNTDYYRRCTKGTPSPSYAHDGRGQAWGMWNYATVDQSRGFNDYLSTNRDATNWQIVRNIRATGEPVGIIAAGGRHSILAVGYTTRHDPLSTAAGNAILGFRVWDPWYGTPWGNWSGWPAGGFAPNSYVTLAAWNSKYFLPDRREGPYFWDYYVAILPSSVAEPPSDNPAPSVGEVAWQQAQAGGASLSTTSDESAAPADPTLAAAIDNGLREHNLLNDPTLGNVPEGYSLGRSVSVESVTGESPYELVELIAGARVRAVALVQRTPEGYRLGELRPVTGFFRLPTLTGMRSTLSANGLEGTPRLVWDWTSDGSPMFMPFLAGRDSVDGSLSIISGSGLLDRREYLQMVRADN